MKQTAKSKIADTAKRMLDGSGDYLEDACRIIALRDDIDTHIHDADFIIFSVIAQEYYEIRDNYSEQNTGGTNSPIDEIKHSDDYKAAITWAKEHSQAQCLSLIKRFSRK